MKKWFSDKKAGIFFDDIPHIGIRYSFPSMTKEERKSIEKYPFINKKNLYVRLEDYEKNKVYSFEIPKGYCFDGASVPKIFWRVIGSNTDNRFLVAALIHDVLCEHHSYVNNDRQFSTSVFNALLEASNVNPFKRFLMKNSVNFYQRFCGWRKKNSTYGEENGKIQIA